MVVICAGTTGFNLTFDVRYMWMHQKRLQGSHFAHLKQASAANKLMIERRLDPCMSEVFSWADLPEAHMKMMRNEHKPGNMSVLVQAPTTGLRTLGRRCWSPASRYGSAEDETPVASGRVVLFETCPVEMYCPSPAFSCGGEKARMVQNDSTCYGCIMSAINPKLGGLSASEMIGYWTFWPISCSFCMANQLPRSEQLDDAATDRSGRDVLATRKGWARRMICKARIWNGFGNAGAVLDGHVALGLAVVCDRAITMALHVVYHWVEHGRGGAISLVAPMVSIAALVLSAIRRILPAHRSVVVAGCYRRVRAGGLARLVLSRRAAVSPGCFGPWGWRSRVLGPDPGAAWAIRGFHHEPQLHRSGLG